MYSQYQSSTQSVGLAEWLRDEQRIVIELSHRSQAWNDNTNYDCVGGESNEQLVTGLQVQSGELAIWRYKCLA